MKLRGVLSLGAFTRRLRSADAVLREAAIDAAVDALRNELQHTTADTLFVAKHGARRAVGSTDAASAAREFGTLEQSPSPWLAPALPLALEPMRAAADAAAARALSQIGKRKN